MAISLTEPFASRFIEAISQRGSVVQTVYVYLCVYVFWMYLCVSHTYFIHIVCTPFGRFMHVCVFLFFFFFISWLAATTINSVSILYSIFRQNLTFKCMTYANERVSYLNIAQLCERDTDLNFFLFLNIHFSIDQGLAKNNFVICSIRMCHENTAKNLIVYSSMLVLFVTISARYRIEIM